MTCKVACFLSLVLFAGWREPCRAWTATPPHRKQPVRRHVTGGMPIRSSSPLPSAPSTAEASAVAATERAVARLKAVLAREYATFFDPMERSFYKEDVTFDDPLTSLSGVDAYRTNVDMLASRTLLGRLLFRDAGIVLHGIEGGDVDPRDGTIADIVTRWTLRMTVQVLPWSPTARFTGVSVYRVVPGGPEGVLVVQQNDYWDSINLREGGAYGRVDKGLALRDFLGQLSPGNLQAPSAAPELPYQLLRRGQGYEVRRYPAFVAVETSYARRDEGYAMLDAATKGRSPLAPALMTVANDGKTMQWPLEYALPGESMNAGPSLEDSLREQPGCRRVTVPERVVAVGTFQDASLEPVVRRADTQLRADLKRDGIRVSGETLTFAQYDAVFSVGQRRGEVWIPLMEGSHPWSL